MIFRIKRGHEFINRIDLLGKRFGALAVIEVHYGVQCGKRKRTLCKCICDCGNTKTVCADYLRTKFPSCGCVAKARRIEASRKDLTGMKFGKLYVKEMIWSDKPARCKCVCDCGTVCTVRSAQLLNGKTRSCGCLQRSMTSKANTKNYTNMITPYGVRLVNRAYKKNGVWMWNCVCPICGNTFVALPAKLWSGHTTSCGCKIESSKERFIESLLEEYQTEYKKQYSFSDCRYKYRLKFDFVVKTKGGQCIAIEYDGKQHFTPIEFFGGAEAFEKTQIRDKIKNEYCDRNSIQLLRIPYTYTEYEIKKEILNIINP